MRNRCVNFVPAVFAGILAAANLAATELRAQATADSCLTSPKGTTPEGSHWYYRIDRVTKRQCWYLREEDSKGARAGSLVSPPPSAAAASAPATTPNPEQSRTVTRKVIAEARAEWLTQRDRTDSPPAAQRMAAAVPANDVGEDKRATGTNVLAPTPLSKTRWPDASGSSAASSPADVRTAAANPVADQPQEPAQVQQPVAAPFAAFAEPSAAKPTASLQMLLVVIAAALALAGITVSLVVRIGRARARAVVRRNRRKMWDSAPTRRPSPTALRGEDARVRQVKRAPVQPAKGVQHAKVPQPAHAPDHRERQVTDMLAQLARSGRR
jgi:hypothetical protein